MKRRKCRVKVAKKCAKIETAKSESHLETDSTGIFKKNSSSQFLSRAKISEGRKSREEVLEWYNRINTDTITYVVQSMPDLDVSDFYRWIIGKSIVDRLRGATQYCISLLQSWAFFNFNASSSTRLFFSPARSAFTRRFLSF